MNRYRHAFAVVCPNNGVRVEYVIEIETSAVIMVEEIVAACRIETGFQEGIADELLKALGGRQVIRACHHGVEIETVRGR